MPYILLRYGKITTNIHTVQYAKTRIFISKFRSFFAIIYVFFKKNHSHSNPLGCTAVIWL